MHGDIIKGSDDEIKPKSENAKLPFEIKEDNIKHLKYVRFDFETDASNKKY